MVNPTYPGVYIREVSSGVSPIAAASTSVPVFVGTAQRGPILEPTRIFSFTEFKAKFGTYINDSYLAHSVYHFFNNGGGSCYILRVAITETFNEGIQDPESAIAADITIRSADGLVDSLIVSAANPGVWGNSLELLIEAGSEDPLNEFNISVFEGDSLQPSEVYANVSMAQGAPNFVERATQRSNLIRVQLAPDTGDEGEQALRRLGTSRSSAPIVMPGVGESFSSTRLQLQINGDQPFTIDLSEAPGNAPNPLPLTSIAEIAAAIQAHVRAVQPTSGSVDPAAYTGFTAQGVNFADEDGGETDALLLRSGSAMGDQSSVHVIRPINPEDSIATRLNLGGFEILGEPLTRPAFNSANLQRYLVGDHVADDTTLVSSVTEGSDGSTIDNDVPFANALDYLDSITDASILCIPGRSSPFMFDRATSYCENRSLSDMFYIGDANPDLESATEYDVDYLSSISLRNSYGAIYAPWCLTPDPTGQSSKPIEVPPCGFAAGLFAKTDNQRGVWKAPAGTAAGISGALGLSKVFSDKEQGILNPKSLNVIREFPSAGRVIWGSRTIANNKEWGYIPVRRMAIFLRVSIFNGIQWAVFEPNDQDLWNNLALNIRAFMSTLFRRGAFQGATASEAFFVKVDKETTTQADIDNGIVNIQVGFAPLKPAEFVVVSLSQKAGQQ